MQAQLKTQKTTVSPQDFINQVSDEQQREDSKRIYEMMKKATGVEGKMWGPAIIGFKDVHLKYESGRELDWFSIGFSPRKQSLTLYVMNDKVTPDLLDKLGKHSTGKGCLYIKRLSDVDTKILEQIIKTAV